MRYLSLFLCVLGMASPAHSEPTATRPAGVKVRIVLVGDSTVTDREGWGPGLKARLVDEVECINTAKGGRSSKSFRDEGHWDKAVALKGDYALIQFGHNDQPGKGPKLETDPATTYPENLKQYIKEVREAGGKPILITPMARRWFDKDNKIRRGLQPYADAVLKVAAEEKVPAIDLHKLTIELCEKLGPETSNELGPIKDDKPDRTHLNAKGAEMVGRIVADELKKAVPDLAPYLK
jgi:pectinesterase